MKQISILILGMLLSSSILAGELSAGQRRSALSAQQVERVKACRNLLQGAEGKSLEERIREIESSDYPEENLQLLETVSKAFADLVKEHNVTEKKNQEWLFSVVELNMAYLQLGGMKASNRHQDPLYRLVQYKLRLYLPPELADHPGIFSVLEY